MSKNTFFISAPKNVHSSTKIYILRGLEAVILTGTVESVECSFCVFKNTFRWIRS